VQVISLRDRTEEEIERIDPMCDVAKRAAKLKRAMLEDTVKITNYGRTVGLSHQGKFQLIGQINEVMLQYLYRTRGWDWLKGDGFLKWLKRHPEYQVGSTKLLIRG
jgi:hypothetical protein